jgi:hypothetical protein
MDLAMSPVERWSWMARVREFFLQEHAERAVDSLSDERAKLVRAYHTAGVRRLRVAQDLRGPEEVQATLSLYRSATLFLSQALLLVRDEQADVDALSLADALATLNSAAPALELPSELAVASVVLLSTDPLLFDRMSAQEAGHHAEVLERVAEWLAARVDPRTRGDIKTTRIVRLGVAAAALLGLLVWAVVRISAPTNHAKGKTAVSSSAAFGSTPQAVVDGSKEDRFGLHTNLEPNASFTVDLGADYDISKIKVFGRADCCYEQSVPLDLELSSDGVTFAKVGARAEPFSQSDPWVVSLAGKTARHVRLRTENTAYLVLSEVEVFGKKK